MILRTVQNAFTFIKLVVWITVGKGNRYFFREAFFTIMAPRAKSCPPQHTPCIAKYQRWVQEFIFLMVGSFHSDIYVIYNHYFLKETTGHVSVTHASKIFFHQHSHCSTITVLCSVQHFSYQCSTHCEISPREGR